MTVAISSTTLVVVLSRELLYVLVVYVLVRSILISKSLSAIVVSRRRLPPGPTGFPVVGALPLLGNMPHVALARMAKKYGPVMYLKTGTLGMVVASTPSSAKAFLKTLDSNFSNRPANAGATHLAYGAQDMVFAPYGPRWRLMRRLSNLHMLGGKALDGWANVRASELGHMLEAMNRASRDGEVVVVAEMLVYAMANMIGQVILSRRVFVTKGEEVNEFKDMVVELMTSAGYFNIGDFVPMLAWMDLQGIERGMKGLHKKFDELITRMLEQHAASAHTPDFLDAIIAASHDDYSSGERLSTSNIKALLLNLFTAGTDTSSSTIEWALSEMVKNPEILKRAQEEMDRVVGRERRLVESDLKKLPYLEAICKETFRKHPSTPLNLPRISSEACVVNGHYIPKGTRLSVNIWAVGRDPEVWEDPLEFNPDRFLLEHSKKMDPRGNDFELMPFGAGRRICAGTRMGILLVQYILATLVHSFDWKLPPPHQDNTIINMDETFGIALQKAVPLEALVTPRLPLHCYLP